MSHCSSVPILFSGRVASSARGRHSEQAVQIVRVVDDAGDLFLDLLLAHEDVRVVLRHVPDAEQAVQRARDLVAVQRRRLGVPQRQLAVGAQLAAEEQHVAGAVHRLHRPAALVHLELEHQVLVRRKVTRGDEGLLVVDDRRLDLEVAALVVLALADLLELVPDHHPLRVPERRTRRVLVEVDEVELDAETPVISFLRLLEPLEVGVEVGLRVERRPVDPRQLRVLLVAAPVGAGEPGQLDRLDRLRVLEVRAAAEIGEVALRVERDLALGGVDELDLVVLALLGKEALGLVGGDLLPLPGPAFLQLAPDLLFDPLERVLADRLRKLEVVVEAVLDRRPDRDLRARDTGGERPRRGGARRSAEGRRARRDRPCRASSGSGSAARPRAGAADPGHARSRGRGRLPWPISGRLRQQRRARLRLREVRVRTSREE